MVQNRQGDFHADHTVDLPIIAQGDGVGDGLIAADRVILQIKRLRPVAQHLRLGVRVLPGGLPGHIVKGIGLPVSLAAHGEVGRPVAAKGDAHLLGQPGAAPGQLQVRVVRRLGIGVRVPDIKAGDGPFFRRVAKGRQEEKAAGIAAVGLPEADGEHRQQKFLLPLL